MKLMARTDAVRRAGVPQAFSLLLLIPALLIDRPGSGCVRAGARAGEKKEGLALDCRSVAHALSR